MDIFDTADLLAQRDPLIHTYEEFFRGQELSLGLSVWPAGIVDNQQPHAEDEVYYVMSGRGRIRVGEDDRPVQAGSVIFVAAQVPHHFHDVEESLHVLVFWAPPHHSRE